MKPLSTVVGILGFVAGFVDAAGYLGLSGVFTSHVTGNLAVLGARLARRQIHAGGGVAVLAFIPLFALAVMLAGVISRRFRGTRLGDAGAILFAESGVLAFTALAGYLCSAALVRGDNDALLWIGGMAVLAMGMQNGLMRESFGGEAATTVMTTNLTQLSLDILEVLRTRRSDAQRSATVLARVQDRGAALGGFILGAAAGAALENALGMLSLVLPAAMLALLALRTIR